MDTNVRTTDLFDWDFVRQKSLSTFFDEGSFDSGEEDHGEAEVGAGSERAEVGAGRGGGRGERAEMGRAVLILQFLSRKRVFGFSGFRLLALGESQEK